MTEAENQIAFMEDQAIRLWLLENDFNFEGAGGGMEHAKLYLDWGYVILSACGHAEPPTSFTDRTTVGIYPDSYGQERGCDAILLNFPDLKSGVRFCLELAAGETIYLDAGWC